MYTTFSVHECIKSPLFIVLGGGGFADFESAFSSKPKPEEQQAVGGGEKSSLS